LVEHQQDDAADDEDLEVMGETGRGRNLPRASATKDTGISMT
jgi:hypothetical protein